MRETQEEKAFHIHLLMDSLEKYSKNCSQELVISLTLYDFEKVILVWNCHRISQKFNFQLSNVFGNTYCVQMIVTNITFV